MKDCIFCRIASGEIPADLIFNDDKVVAFRDISPQAPYHFLVIPREHFSSIQDIDDENLIGHMVAAGNQIAEDNNIKSFRYVINTGEEAGQSVFHVHLHLLGGRRMNWPPG